MGLLDQITGMIGGGGEGGILAAITKLINDNGGLKGLLEKFKAAGYDKQVKSWIGLDANQELTGEQVEKTLGGEQIAAFATSLGIDKDAAKAKIAEYLPKIIDKLTPAGDVPPDNLVGQGLEALKATFGTK